MGSGASFDAGLGLDTDMQRYMCHSCNRVLTSTSLFPDFICPHCSSSFIEEINGATRYTDLPLHRRNNRFGDIFGDEELTPEQFRRVTNASAMLRLLDTQLREELEHLQFAFENNSNQIAEVIRTNRSAPPVVVKKKLSKIMAGKMRLCKLDLDVLCSQPSCPICNEDFSLTTTVTKLPCTHVFHHSCVVPWLELKQNCPICRADLTDEVPSLTELHKYSTEELTCWMELIKLDDNKGDSGDYSHCYDSLNTEPPTAPLTSRRSEGKEGEGKECEGKESETQQLVVKPSSTEHSKSELVLKLQEELVLYHRQTAAETEAAASAQLRQQQAQQQAQQRLHNFNLSDLMSRAAQIQDQPVRTYFRYDAENNPFHAANNLVYNNHPAARNTYRGNLEHSASVPNASVHAIDAYIANPTAYDRRSSNESNAFAAALRAGLNQPNTMNTNTQVTTNADSSSLEGSTLLPNGMHLHHSIRIVDASDSDDSDNEASQNRQQIYASANLAHLARFGVGGVPHVSIVPNTTRSSTTTNNSNSSRSHSTPTSGTHDPATEAIIRNFNHSMYPELDLLATHMPAAERNLINSHNEGLDHAQLLNSIINGDGSRSLDDTGSLSRSLYPTWHEEVDDILTTGGLSAINRTAGLDSSHISTSGATGEAAMRSAQIANINRYMDTDTALRFNALNNSSTSTSANNNNDNNANNAGNSSSASTAAITPTTYQIRATGDGSFMTVPVTFSNGNNNTNNI